jgi:hypothetical protein
MLPRLVDGLRTWDRQRAELQAEQAHLEGFQRADQGLDAGTLRTEMHGWLTLAGRARE